MDSKQRPGGLLAGKSAERTIPVDIAFSETPGGFALMLTDDEGHLGGRIAGRARGAERDRDHVVAVARHAGEQGQLIDRAAELALDAPPGQAGFGHGALDDHLQTRGRRP